jgi:hypothetical protein
MSHWFGEPHTFVSARARIELRYLALSAERDWLRAKPAACAERATAAYGLGRKS